MPIREFEQAKPVIEDIKARSNNIKIVCSFYSPSGYVNQKNYEYADSVCYMLFDSISNANLFIEKISPEVAVFIRYDIWRNHLKTLAKKQIPAYLINATFPTNKILTNSLLLRQFTKSNYELFDEIITINDQETRKFYEQGIKTNITSLSDTRFDRIIAKVEEAKNNPIISKELFKDELILIAGSSWPKDEELLYDAVNKINAAEFKLRVIFVPHEPTLRNLERLQSLVPDSILLSKLEISQAPELKNKHIIVDSIGKLLRLYSLADFVYVGGGFGAGVHSVAEPAGYGLPIMCGPKYTNSPDAVALKQLNSLEPIEDADEALQWLLKMLDEENRDSVGRINGKYITDRQGTSEIIADKIIDTIHQKQLSQGMPKNV